ncbi:MAG: TetR/AcrR family transcriptional regulator [Mycobacterium sp.]|uniref:TetR/AcrR family transcriptional regulator n=2 Tax=Mycobacterium sp. TaxID=1785 RepID=UPI003F993CC4
MQSMALSIAQLDQGPAPGEDATVDRVAAAAFEMFAEYGIRRATIDDVARRAGVSKMTVFRRFQSKQGLVGVVIAREIRRGMAELDRVWEREQTLEQRVVLGFSFAVNFVRGHALFDRLLRSEPELLLPLLTIDGTAALALYRELIGQRLRTEVRAGRAAPADVDQAAEVLARLAISLLLTREGTITLDDDETIVALVRNVLLPMLDPRDG